MSFFAENEPKARHRAPGEELEGRSVCLSFDLYDFFEQWRQENNFVEIPNVNDLAWHQVLPQHVCNPWS